MERANMSKEIAIQLLNEAYDCVEKLQYQLAKEKLEKALTYADEIPDIHSEYVMNSITSWTLFRAFK